MRLSASAINTYLRCGYKYKLDYLDKARVVRKRGFALLYGDIVGAAAANAVKEVSKGRTDTENIAAECLRFAWETFFRQAGIPDVLLSSILDYLNGDADAAQDIDLYANCVNQSEYEFKLPKRLKNGKLSTSKPNPSLSCLVQESFDMVLWFLDSPMANSFISQLKDIALEKPFLADNTGHTFSGRFDLWAVFPDGTPLILEFKCTKTEYTPELVNRLNQVVMYQLAEPTGVVVLVDLRHKNVLQAEIPPETIDRYRATAGAVIRGIEAEIFLPICSTDPYTEKTIICEHRCVTCPFGGSGDGELHRNTDTDDTE